jgi:cysteine-rich secretory family protein
VPSLPGAGVYGVAVDDPPSREEAEIVRLVDAGAVAAQVRAPTWEGRLARVARDLARAVPEDGPPSGRLVDFLGWHHGLVEPSPHLVVVETSRPRPPEADRMMKTRLRSVLAEAQGRFTRVGVGLRGSRCVVALGESPVDLAPVPRALSIGERAEIRARVRPPYVRGEGFLESPDGSIGPLARTDGALSGTVSCGQPGRFQVEITGEDRFGAAVLANFPIWCGVEPPGEIAATDASPPPRTAEEAEAAIVGLVQRDRRAAGLPELRADKMLAELSRAHSEDMRDRRYVGHVAPHDGGPAQRAARAGLRAAVLLENVARAYSPEDVEDGLLSSPGHRENILDARVTHLGVGVALGPLVGQRRELWVTQTFARFE